MKRLIFSVLVLSFSSSLVKANSLSGKKARVDSLAYGWQVFPSTVEINGQQVKLDSDVARNTDIRCLGADTNPGIAVNTYRELIQALMNKYCSPKKSFAVNYYAVNLGNQGIAYAANAAPGETSPTTAAPYYLQNIKYSVQIDGVWQNRKLDSLLCDFSRSEDFIDENAPW